LSSLTSPSSSGSWQPPSAQLELRDGLWQVASVSPVSYPEAGNEVYFQVEDGSFWFKHRMDCIHAVIRQFPPAGTLYDIGGGNGYVAAALQAAGTDVALLEPGHGARNALRRGVHKVICATLEDAGLSPHSLPAAGAFDVVEHIQEDVAFLRSIHARLAPGGRFYCTVPAFGSLWSDEDRHAGHARRYSRATLVQALQDAGFTVEFTTYFFTWLTLPVLLFRALPSKMRLTNRAKIGTIEATRADHELPRLLRGLIGRAHAWELGRLARRQPLPFGTSLLCVARARDTA
jgi:SAM-dependent methyltransferase